jgi:hypothetical protein
MIALSAAILLAICVFKWTDRTQAEQYEREYPHDGQDGLGAFVDAAVAGGLTLFGAFAGFYLLQRMVTSVNRSASNSPTSAE